MRPTKVEKALCFVVAKVASYVRQRWATNIQYYFFRRWGMRFNGRPNYLSTKIWFDGSDYSLISIGSEVTMSSYIRVLTHDWALHTVAKALGIAQERPLGRTRGVAIGDYSFVGTGTILMPGSEIGRGCVIGAGTVVRGKVPDFSIYTGSPGKVVGDVREYVAKAMRNPVE